MSLLSIGELRDLVQTSLSAESLQSIIDREEQNIIDMFGAHYVDTSTAITETKPGGRGQNIYTCRPILSVTSISEALYIGSTPALLDPANYYVWASEGRIERVPGLPTARELGSQAGRLWGDIVVIVYVPRDDSSRRKQALIELCRIALERTAMKSESVAGEYSYQAPDWDQTRARIYRSYRLGYMEI